jgi:hypothetical protein
VVLAHATPCTYRCMARTACMQHHTCHGKPRTPHPQVCTWQSYVWSWLTNSNSVRGSTGPTPRYTSMRLLWCLSYLQARRSALSYFTVYTTKMVSYTAQPAAGRCSCNSSRTWRRSPAPASHCRPTAIQPADAVVTSNAVEAARALGMNRIASLWLRQQRNAAV